MGDSSFLTAILILSVSMSLLWFHVGHGVVKISGFFSFIPSGSEYFSWYSYGILRGS